MSEIEIKKPEPSPDVRMEAVKLAAMMLPQKFIPGRGSETSYYEERPFRDITRRADEILDYVYGVAETAPVGLIKKLRAVLCEDGK